MAREEDMWRFSGAEVGIHDACGLQFPAICYPAAAFAPQFVSARTPGVLSEGAPPPPIVQYRATLCTQVQFAQAFHYPPTPPVDNANGDKMQPPPGGSEAIAIHQGDMDPEQMDKGSYHHHHHHHHFPSLPTPPDVATTSSEANGSLLSPSNGPAASSTCSTPLEGHKDGSYSAHWQQNSTPYATNMYSIVAQKHTHIYNAHHVTPTQQQHHRRQQIPTSCPPPLYVHYATEKRSNTCLMSEGNKDCDQQGLGMGVCVKLRVTL